jgi:Cytochrome c oxidase subunit IV
MHSSEGSADVVPQTESQDAPHEPATSEGGHGAGDGDIHLPPPSIWPVTTAGGVAIAGLGLVTSFTLSILGLVIMFYGVFAWVQELRHEHH